jgi:hypothetical protein
MWDAVNGVCNLHHDTTTTYRLGHTLVFLKFTPTCTHIAATRVYPYAHPQHPKVLKHFIYIQYGCGMQLMGVGSLTHDTITSNKLCHTYYGYKGVPI